jgi:hypothetical protein
VTGLRWLEAEREKIVAAIREAADKLTEARWRAADWEAEHWSYTLAIRGSHLRTHDELTAEWKKLMVRTYRL